MTDTEKPTILRSLGMTAIGFIILFFTGAFIYLAATEAAFPNTAPTETSCPVEMQTATLLKEIQENGLQVTQYTGTRFDAIMAIISEEFGPAPAEFDTLWVVYFPEHRMLNLGFFKSGCFVTAISGISLEMWNNFYSRALRRTP